MVADLEVRIARLFDYAHRSAQHHAPERNRGHVRTFLSDPAAIRRVERQIEVADENLTVLQFRHGFFSPLKIRLFDHTYRTRDQSPLMIDSFCHSMFSLDNVGRLQSVREPGRTEVVPHYDQPSPLAQ